MNAPEQPQGNSESDLHMIALVKDEERYLFMYTNRTHRELIKILGTFADNPELSFTWTDAVMLADKVRLQIQDTLEDSYDSEQTTDDFE